MPAKNTYAAFDYFEALYKKTKENTVIIMETNGTVAAVNSAFTECFGYEETDIVGKNTAILFTEEDRLKGYPKKELDEVLHKGQSNDNNYLVNKDQEKTWVSGESILVEDDEGKKIVLKIVQNIHRQKTSEIAVRELNAFNENILESIRDMVIVLDPQMNIVKANRSCEVLCNGWKDGAVNFSILLRTVDIDGRLNDLLKEVEGKKSGFSNKEVPLLIRGDKRIFEVSCSKLEQTGEKNLLLVLHDVTIYKDIEREREDIIGFITHELRNPLSNLMLSNDLMKEAAEGNEVTFLKQMLERSEKNVQRMNKMISSLYEATKVHSGYFPLDLSEFNFGNMVREAIDTIQTLHPDFTIRSVGDGDFKAVADRYHLIQVITNFLSNAIKYSAGKKEIKLTIYHNEKTVSVHVEDNGIGITKDQLPYVFERFFRIEKTRAIEGIGLGLYLCQQIIRSHKGRVGVESEENRGSDFYFTIPIDSTKSDLE